MLGFAGQRRSPDIGHKGLPPFFILLRTRVTASALTTRNTCSKISHHAPAEDGQKEVPVRVQMSVVGLPGSQVCYSLRQTSSGLEEELVGADYQSMKSVPCPRAGMKQEREGPDPKAIVQ